MNDGTTAAIAAGGVLVAAAIAGYATRPRRVAVGRARGGAVSRARAMAIRKATGNSPRGTAPEPVIVLRRGREGHRGDRYGRRYVLVQFPDGVRQWLDADVDLASKAEY